MDSSYGAISDSSGKTVLESGEYGRGFKEVPALPIDRIGKVGIDGKCPESSYDMYFLSWGLVLSCFATSFSAPSAWDDRICWSLKKKKLGAEAESFTKKRKILPTCHLLLCIY